MNSEEENLEKWNEELFKFERRIFDKHKRHPPISNPVNVNIDDFNSLHCDIDGKDGEQLFGSSYIAKIKMMNQFRQKRRIIKK